MISNHLRLGSKSKGFSFFEQKMHSLYLAQFGSTRELQVLSQNRKGQNWTDKLKLKHCKMK